MLSTKKLRNYLNLQKFENLSNLGESALQKKNYQKAQDCFDRLRQQWPDSPNGWLGLFKIANVTQLPTKSIKIIRAAYDRLPANLQIKLKLADANLAIGNVDDAEALINSVLSEKPEHPWAAFSLARIAGRKDHWQIAKQRWLSVKASQPDHITPIRGLITCYRNLGEFDAAIAAHETIVERKQDRPVDHYWLACLRANKNGSWLSVGESNDYICRFPDDGEIAALHAVRLQRSGDLPGAIDFLEKACLREFTEARAVHIQRAVIYEMLQEYERAADYFLKCHHMQPGDFSAIVNAARCLAKANHYQAAQDLLIRTSNGEQCDRLLLAQADTYQLSGDNRHAIRYVLSAVRICANVSNIGKLCTLLTETGRLKLAKRFLRGLENEHGQIVPAWKMLAVIAIRHKDFSTAYQWLKRYLKIRPGDFSAIRLMSDVLWQKGQSERAWYANLAYASNRSAFISEVAAVREKELITLKSQLNDAQALLSSACDHTQCAAASQNIQRLMNRPTAFKSYPWPNIEIDRIGRKLRRLEKHGDAEGVLRLVNHSLSTVIARTTVPDHIGGFLYRAAQVCEKAGWFVQSIRLLEKAIWINKRDKVLLTRYRTLLRETNPHLSIEGKPRVVVLILTWMKNVSRARLLARHIHDQTGRSIVTLVGNPEADSSLVAPQPYGYQMTVPCSDGYLALPQKMLLAYRYLFACSNCRGVFKIDDDIIIENFNKFEELIAQCHRDESGYVGWVHQYTNPIYHHGRHECTDKSLPTALHKPVDYCGGGEGYFLSRSSLEKIFNAGLTHFSCEQGTVYEDVFIGEILASFGVRPTHKHMHVAGGYMKDCYESMILTSTMQY